MKKIFGCTIGLGFLLLIAALWAQEKSPGFVDFGKLPASAVADSGDQVEVNLGRAIFAITGKFFEKSEPEVASLLRGLHRVQVNVVGMADDNRPAIQEHIRKLRAELSGKGWERIVSVKDGKDDVAIFLKTRGEEAVEGLVVQAAGPGTLQVRWESSALADNYRVMRLVRNVDQEPVAPQGV